MIRSKLPFLILAAVLALALLVFSRIPALRNALA